MSKPLNIPDCIIESVRMYNSGINARRNQDIAILYFGFDGRGGLSMENVGRKFGLTRESIRQITTKVAEFISRDDELKNLLRETKSSIEGLAPGSANSVEKSISIYTKNNKLYRLEGIINALRLCFKKEFNLIIIKEKRERFMVCSNNEGLPRRALSYLVKDVSKNGAASINKVRARIEEELAVSVSESFVKDVCSIRKESAFIGDVSGQWVYFGKVGRNRLVNRINKLFSHVNNVAADDLLQGIERSWNKNTKYDAELLPKAVLISLVKDMAGFKVSYCDIKKDYIINGEVSESEKVKLDGFEMRIFEEIAKSDIGSCREKYLEDKLVKNVKDKYSFSMMLNYSPIIIRKERPKEKRKEKGRFYRGVYYLIGASRC